MRQTFEQLRSEVCRDWKAQAKYRDEMREDRAFNNGHQWTDVERTAIENDTGKACITFNRTQTVISAVAGSEINNRTEVRFIPREIGDVKPNEVLSAGAEWFRDESDAEDSESSAFSDLLICGIGWTETWLDWDEDDDGDPRVTHIPPDEMCWDRHCHNKGLDGARRKARVRCVSKAEALEMFPGKRAHEIHAGWIDVTRRSSMTADHVGDEYRYDDPGGADIETPDELTLVQVQWREKSHAIEYIDQAGQKKEIPKQEWDRLTKLGVPTAAIQNRRVTRYEWHQAYLGRAGFIDTSQPCKRRSTFTAMTGHWDDEDNRFFGLLRAMRDPQKYANKWLTQTLHIINTNAKGGVVMERDAVDDVRQFEESWAASDEVSWVREGALTEGKMQPKPQLAFPQSLMALTEMAVAAIRDVPGVPLELMGLTDRDQPNVLEASRKKSAIITLAFYFDALRYYRKQQGHVILGFLVDWIAPTGRLVRIVRNEIAQYVPLAIDPQTTKYDVIVEDAPSAPNEKDRAWDALQNILPIVGPALDPETWLDILEFSPVPPALTDKIRRRMEEKKQEAAQKGPDPLHEAMVRQTLAEASKKEGEVELNAAKTEETRADAMKTFIEAGMMREQAQARTLADLIQAPQTSNVSDAGVSQNVQ